MEEKIIICKPKNNLFILHINVKGIENNTCEFSSESKEIKAKNV